MISKIRDNISKVIIGMDQTIDLLLSAFLAGGHVLLEDMPGTGKTVMSRALACSIDGKFGRIQFTPDLLPGDVTGISYFHPEKKSFIFREGPVFANILLADEINRATPRTQSALLECMGEGQVTADGVSRVLEEPFFVIATQNPVETYGCFPLPEAQLDRFMMKLRMNDLSAAGERQILDLFLSGRLPDKQIQSLLTPVISKEDAVSMRARCREIYVHADLRDYMIALTRETRSGSLAGARRKGVSPRGTLALLRASQGYAMVMGRDYVVPEDIKTVAVPVLAHRFICESSDDLHKEKQISELLSKIPVPTEDWRRS